MLLVFSESSMFSFLIIPLFCSVSRPFSTLQFTQKLLLSLSSTPGLYTHPDADRKVLPPWRHENDASDFFLSGYKNDRKTGLLYKDHGSFGSQAKVVESFGKNIRISKKIVEPSPCINVLHIRDKRKNFYSSVGWIKSFYEKKNISTVGTGFLIEPDMVLTAAHNIMFDQLDCLNNTQREIAQIIYFSLTQEKTASIKETCYDHRLPIEWSKSFNPKYDFTVLFLRKNLRTVKFKMKEINEARLLPIAAEVIGYPSVVYSEEDSTIEEENNPLCKYTSPGLIVGFDDTRELLRHTSFTSPGNSGGPIAIDMDSIPVCVGIHTTGVTDFDTQRHNAGIHCTNHVIKYLKQWAQERAVSHKNFGNYQAYQPQ